MSHLKQLVILISIELIALIGVMVIIAMPKNKVVIEPSVATIEAKDIGATHEFTVNCSDGVCYDPKTGYEIGNLPGKIFLSTPVLEDKKETP